MTAVAEELERLLRFVTRPGRRFELAVARYRYPEVARAHRTTAIDAARAAGRQVHSVELDVGADAADIFDVLVEQTRAGADVLFVTGLEPRLRDPSDTGVAMLNQRRDLLPQRVPARVVLWIERDALPLFAEAARDTYDVVRTVFELDDVIEGSPELERYLAKAEALYREVHLIGFETKVRVAIELHDLYVPLDAVLDRSSEGWEFYSGVEHEQALGVGEAHRQREQVVLAEAFGRARALGKRGLVLLGDPGSGKTTHLKEVLLEVVRKGAESLGLPADTVPVFLPLRNLRDSGGGLLGFVQQELSDPMLHMAPDFGPWLCQRGGLLFLLDGLDEVANADERAEVARWIEQARRATTDCFFLVSSRYAGYTADVGLGEGFLELHLRPFDDAQMQAFIARWYRIVERASHRDPAQARVRAEQGAKELLEVLSGVEFTAVARVYEMARNPLLLTAICLVHRDRGRLPRARAQLYEESIGVLLDRWRRRLPQALHPSDSRELLQPVALWIHGEQGRTRASLAQLRGPLERAVARLPRVTLDIDRFLRSIRDDSGLLTGWGIDQFGFMHLGFQEYLAARELRSRGLEDPSVFDALAERFGESWWQEVILLMLALRDPGVFEPFMRAVVRRPEFEGWWESEMMQLCLEEAVAPSARPFVELLQAPEGPGVVERQVAAAKLLARAMSEALEGLEELLSNHPAQGVRQWWNGRRVRSAAVDIVVSRPSDTVLVRIPGGRFTMGEGNRAHEVELESFYLARTPVTNAQYAAFMKANPTVEEPERWGDRRFNQPKQPVVGISWHEAQAYCEWAGLTLPTEAQWEYACRAGTTTRYYSGNSEADLARVGWYAGNSDGRAHPVGEKEPNGFGLYDMHGNVWEWCLDNHGSYETSPRSGDGLRHEPEGDASRVGRGGAFGFTAGYARSAIRVRYWPGIRFRWLGFRPAQGIP